MSEDSFLQTFSSSPIKRIGLARFIRNVAVAAGNSRNKLLVPVVEEALRAWAGKDEMVAEHLEWAKSRLMAASGEEEATKKEGTQGGETKGEEQRTE